jgi:hypothetical protein
LLAYFVAVTRFALWQRIPWPFMAMTAAGALLGAGAFLASPGLATAGAGLASAALLAFLLWHVLVYSQFGAREDQPRVADPFPDFALPDSRGATRRPTAIWIISRRLAPEV